MTTQSEFLQAWNTVHHIFKVDPNDPSPSEATMKFILLVSACSVDNSTPKAQEVTNTFLFIHKLFQFAKTKTQKELLDASIFLDPAFPSFTSPASP